MLPFSLDPRNDGTWRSRWVEEQLFIVVGGSPNAAHPELVATVTQVVLAWPEVRDTVAAYVAGLPADAHVPLEPADHGGFAARSCGFDHKLYFDSISVPDPAQPDRVEVTFYTGFPDGYAAYRVALTAGHPTAVTAYSA